jgi:hypothetical protein
MKFSIDRLYRLHRLHPRHWRNTMLLAVLGTSCALAHAAPPANEPARTRAVDTSAAMPAPLPDEFNAAADDELDTARGGTGTTIDTRLAGQVSGNTATNVQTGWNVINGGAFANMTGIPIVVQNSGANVLIQNATVIQLQLQ